MTAQQKSPPPSKVEFKLEPLSWLFVADFEDGTSIVQDQDDKSLTRTDGTGSTFTDVLAHKSKLISFCLINKDTDSEVTVDLTSGIFVVNGTPIALHDQFFEPDKHDLRLIYFRETKAEQNIGGDGSVLSTAHYVNRYFIGWQTTVKGKNVKATLAVGN